MTIFWLILTAILAFSTGASTSDAASVVMGLGTVVMAFNAYNSHRAVVIEANARGMHLAHLREAVHQEKEASWDKSQGIW